jgi:hypothetical protein
MGVVRKFGGGQPLAIALTREVTWGRGERFTMRAAPSTPLVPHRIFTNAPARGLFKVNLPTIGVVAPGDVHSICETFNVALPELGTPPLTKKRPLVCNVEYSGETPKGHREGAKFILIVTVQGPPSHLQRVK